MRKLFTLSLIGFFLMGTLNINAQKKETGQEKREERNKLKELKLAQQNKANIESLNFSFYPNSIETDFGVTNQLMGMADFYVTVDKTTMYMNLPYMGNFYINPITPAITPVNVISSKLLYTIHTTDNVNFQITVIPTDLTSTMNDGLKFVFSLNKNSNYARLIVSANNRQDITYIGNFN